MEIALALSVSPTYVAGAVVALSSFLASNGWFRGPVLILDNGLSGADIARLRRAAPGLSVIDPGPEFEALRTRMQGQAGARRVSNFAKGAVLRLEGTERVLLIDADLLFRADVSDALDRAGTVLACPDAAQLSGRARGRRDASFSAAARDGALRQSFSSGFLVLGPAARGAARFAAYLGHMADLTAAAVPSGLTDQAVFNVMFEGDVHLLDQRYNFLLRAPELMPLAMEDARVLHFNTAAKPWDPAAALAMRADRPEVAPAYLEWQAAYRRHLAIGAEG